MHRVYGVRFSLRPTELSAEMAAEAAASQVWRWGYRDAQHASPGWKDGEFVLPGHGRLETATVARPPLALHRLKLSHPDTDTPGLEWHVTVDLLLDAQSLEFGMSIAQHQTHDLIAPEFTAAGTPRLIRSLVNMGARSGHHQLFVRPQVISGSEAVDELANGLLYDPDRRLPVIVVTAFSQRPSHYAVPFDEVSRLAGDLAGLAHVICLPHRDDTFALTAHVGPSLSVFDGAIRTYWPGLDSDAGAFRHRICLPQNVNSRFLWGLRNRIVGLAARTYLEPRQARSLLLQSAQDAARSLLHERVAAAREDSDALVTLYKEEVERLEGKVAELSADLESERQRSEELEETKRQLTYKVSGLRHQLAGGAAPAGEESIPAEEPDSFEEALILAEELCGDTLVITERAKRSACQMNPADNAPGKLWHALSLLNEVVESWRADDLPRGILPALEERGLQPGRVSALRVGQHPHEYTFHYNGHKVSLVYHIDLSRGERIYWYQSDEDRRFVINHIGRHLSDSTSG